MNISEDICRCACEDCEKYNECYRGGGHNWIPGIYTFSLLNQICNEKNNFELFIEGDKNG
jgi:hypothetical protein